MEILQAGFDKGLQTHKATAYGWDSNGLSPVKMAVDSNGNVQVALTAAQLATLTPLSTVAISSVGGTVAVTGTFWQATQPISAVSLPLPTGASTEATLSSIDGKTPALGQALAAGSVPVVLTAAQLSTLTPLSTVAVSSVGGSVAVTGTFWQATQPISATSLPLPTGAATETTLSTLAGIVTSSRAAVNLISGQAGVDGGSGVVSSATQRVVLATDVALPTGTNNIGSVSAGLTSEVTGTGNATDATPIAATDVSLYRWVSLQITGSFSSTVLFEGSNDNSNWVNVGLANVSIGSGILQNQTAGTGLFHGPINYKYFRTRLNPYSSGTVSCRAEFFQSVGAITTMGVQASGDVGSASNDSGNPLKFGGKANSSAPSAVTNGQRVNAYFDLNGRLVVLDQTFDNRSDTFTGTGAGVTLDVTTKGLQHFGIQVTPTGAVTSWTVVIEGSLDNVNFTTIATHTNVTPGGGLIQWSGANHFPCRYVRANCTALTLGAGTNVVALIFGVR